MSDTFGLPMAPGGPLQPVREWFRLGAVAPQDLKEARLQVHYAVQWLARVARAALPARRDDSHTSLTWDAQAGGLVTQPLLVDGGPVRLALSFSARGIGILGPNGAEGLIPLDAVTEWEVRDFLAARAARFEIDPSSLVAPLPYNMPHHPLAEGACYGFGIHAEAVRELGRWFENGFDALDNIAGRFAMRSVSPIRIRAWPHHFDIGMLITPSGPSQGLFQGANQSANPSVVGVGMSPGDEVFREPYFYVTPHPQPVYGAHLPPVPSPAGWHHGRSFVGVVLRGGDIVRSPHPRGLVDSVLEPAVEGSMALLRS